jgi:hypothetical protein
LDVEAAPGDGTVVVEDGNDSGGAGTGNTVGIEHVGDVEVVRPSSPAGPTLVSAQAHHLVTTDGSPFPRIEPRDVVRLKLGHRPVLGTAEPRPVDAQELVGARQAGRRAVRAGVGGTAITGAGVGGKAP